MRNPAAEEFGIVSALKVGHGRVTSRITGDELTGLVVGLEGVSSHDGAVMDALVFLLPFQARQLVEGLQRGLATLDDHS